MVIFGDFVKVLAFTTNIWRWHIRKNLHNHIVKNFRVMNKQTNKQTNCVDPLIFQSNHKMSQTSPMSRSKHEPIFEYDSSFSQLPDLVSVILGQLSTQELLKNTP